MIMPAQQEEKVYIYDANGVYQLEKGELFYKWNKVKVPKGSPEPGWLGEKIPFALWQRLLAFCKLTFDDNASEAMALLYYDEKGAEGDKWKAWMCPQITSGMTVRTDPDSKKWKGQRKLFPDMEAGTIHHHCSTSAFASGTDKADEDDRDGLHFTVGKLDEDAYDLHCRFSLEGKSWVIPAETVVAPPEWALSVPAEYLEPIMKKALRTPPDNLPAWRKALRKQLKNVEKKTHAYANNTGHLGQGYFGGHLGYQNNRPREIHDYRDKYWDVDEKKWKDKEPAKDDLRNKTWCPLKNEWVDDESYEEGDVLPAGLDDFEACDELDNMLEPLGIQSIRRFSYLAKLFKGEVVTNNEADTAEAENLFDQLAGIVLTPMEADFTEWDADKIKLVVDRVENLEKAYSVFPVTA